MSLLGDLRQAGRQLAAEAVEGAQRVVLLSHRAWTSRFASAPDVIGAPIVLNDEPHTVFGVPGRLRILLSPSRWASNLARLRVAGRRLAIDASSGVFAACCRPSERDDPGGALGTGTVCSVR